MENLNITFAPELPIWFLAVLTAALLALALFNPSLLQEDRSPLKTIIPLVIDETTSQRLNNRDEQTASAAEDIRQQFEKLDNFELREITVTDQISQTSDVSSALFTSLNNAMQDVPSDQMGGAIFITDGQVHDIPEGDAQTNLNGPLHVIVTGKKEERDRRIVLKNTPRFGVVGESQEIVYEIEETGFENKLPVEVTISLDGEILAVEEVIAGEESSFVFDVPHGGKNIIELSAAIAPNEISEINNRTFTTLNGIRENLRVLLVSGEPHAGERTWRNLLKSDASVDLVHFTILRPPEKQDGTPINQLSLIAFPTRELFVQKIDEKSPKHHSYRAFLKQVKNIQ